MTLVGDVAQSTTPAGQERWADVLDLLAAHRPGRGRRVGLAELTIGYRVPEPILARANELLPFTGVDATASRSVRRRGSSAVAAVDGGRARSGTSWPRWSARSSTATG